MGSLDTTFSFKDYLPTFLFCEMWINTNLIQRFLWNWGTIVLRYIRSKIQSCPAAGQLACLSVGCDLACSCCRMEIMRDCLNQSRVKIYTISCNRHWAGMILQRSRAEQGQSQKAIVNPFFGNSNRGQIKGYSSVSSSVSAEFRPQLESGQFLLFCSSTQR